MPGGRLTLEDRRRIAAWVAEGLAYAEIARRLGRPTSTISREVARDRGPGGYAADRAQQAASQRARRRNPVESAEPSADGRQGDFVERFATVLAATGLPRMAARVFTGLLTSDSGSLTVADLVRRLRVSPASVSKAIAFLEAMELVGRRPDPGSRRERYVIDDDVWERVYRADTGAHADIAQATQEGIDLFGAGTPVGTRLGRMGRFFTRISEEMRGSGLADVLGNDALTLLAALVYAARPLTVADLAEALGWPKDRVSAALAAIDHRPLLADPLALRHTGSDTYAITTRQDRLSPAQREALR